jgi:hypothetical protein
MESISSGLSTIVVFLSFAVAIIQLVTWLLSRGKNGMYIEIEKIKIESFMIFFVGGGGGQGEPQTKDLYQVKETWKFLFLTHI